MYNCLFWIDFIVNFYCNCDCNWCSVGNLAFYLPLRSSELAKLLMCPVLFRTLFRCPNISLSCASWIVLWLSLYSLWLMPQGWLSAIDILNTAGYKYAAPLPRRWWHCSSNLSFRVNTVLRSLAEFQFYFVRDLSSLCCRFSHASSGTMKNDSWKDLRLSTRAGKIYHIARIICLKKRSVFVILELVWCPSPHRLCCL